MPKRSVERSIDIFAAPDRVWQVLTDPDFTKRYMFGCVCATDWRVGSPLLWQAQVEDKTIVYVRGSVLAAEQGRVLSYTTLGEGEAPDDPPLEVVCRLTPSKGMTRLDVSQGDFEGKKDGERRYADTLSGWTEVLPKIKALAEE